jgi:hypothetical protein
MHAAMQCQGRHYNFVSKKEEDVLLTGELIDDFCHSDN